MTRRVAIYARYSSSQQRDASADDQIELCREYAIRQGWDVVSVFDDRAISGASAIGRPGFQRMMDDAVRRSFDLVLAENVDRLGRNLSHTAAAFEKLAYHGVKVVTVANGEVVPLVFNILASVGQQTLSTLRQQTHRGQRFRVEGGHAAGGLGFGYRVLLGTPDAAGIMERGGRAIDPDEAAVVVRIFEAYAADASPRRIAHDLNDEGVPGPGGRPWGDTTIRGQGQRGTGLLNNRLYIGEMVWNRCSYVKHPETGRRLARVNDSAAAVTKAMPDLRIVDQALWDRVKARQALSREASGQPAGSNRLNGAHRAVFLLSGLLTCGCCGGGYTIIGKDRYGCATRRSKGLCGNAKTITRQALEYRVLGGLKDSLLTPDLVATFVKRFAEEVARRSSRRGEEESALKRQVAENERKLVGIVRAIENGAWSDTLATRLKELEAIKALLSARKAQLQSSDQDMPLPPDGASIYRGIVSELAAALDDEPVRGPAAEQLRTLIDTVVLTPDATASSGLSVKLSGRLESVLQTATGRVRGVGRGSLWPGVYGDFVSQLSGVAGTRNCLDLLLTG